MKKKRRKNCAPNQGKENHQPKQQQFSRAEDCININCAGGLSGIPDVSTGPSGTDFALEEGESEESAKEGLFANTFFKECQAIGTSSGTKYLRFRHQLTDNLLVKWDTGWLDKRLYVQIPDDVLVQGSRDSLVAMLDAAEENLGCEHVILCFKRNRLDRAQLIKTFQYMGFTPIAPGHPKVPKAEEYFFMMCEM
ncbi:ornithine decarboxylase antizyme 1-like [Amphiura filiformis]|uniref:ornithine decarboxylase antizyme 1-like n=1 Tax=Amphiura filiformis TaxID=82378 RepID=UPI003B227C09